MKSEDCLFTLVLTVVFGAFFWMISIFTIDIIVSISTTSPLLYPLVCFFFLALIGLAVSIIDVARSLILCKN